MDIIVRNTDSRPIYEQISWQIKQAILCGALEHGAILPSIRALAAELRVSVITTRRAYEDLQRDGFIDMVPGKGCFVNARNRQRIQQEYVRRVEDFLCKALAEAELAGLSLAEIQEILWQLSDSERRR